MRTFIIIILLLIILFGGWWVWHNCPNARRAAQEQLDKVNKPAPEVPPTPVPATQ